MKVTNYKEILPIKMDSEMVKNISGRVMIGKEDGAEKFCMRLFEIGENGHTPMHSHAWEHEVFVHSGDGEVFIKDKWYPVSEGSAIFIPANIEHQFKNTFARTFTFVCIIPSGAPEL